MVPEFAQSPAKSPASAVQDDMMLAGYRECATEAMRWLSGLGYEPGHPLMRSLAAHLTKKQAYLEKIDLEYFLVDQSLRGREEEEAEDRSEDEDGSLFRGSLKALRKDAGMQAALVEAVFRGCDLHYN